MPTSTSLGQRAEALDSIITQRAIVPQFQPIVRLDDREVVGWEALARGPEGSSLHRPDQLFATARSERRLAELDELCRTRAVEAALAVGLGPGRWLSVNVEPEAVAAATGAGDRRAALVGDAGSRLDVVVELTERELIASPATLLRLVQEVRAQGCRVALDDVGAEPASLALMPLLRPDVIKLDLRLVQQRPTVDVARIMSAVNAEAERSGAVVLAEGVETDEHLEIATSLGAVLGQGWLFGRPGPLPDAPVDPPRRPVVLPRRTLDEKATTPMEAAGLGATSRTARKDLLIEVSKHLEAEALGLGQSALVLSTFQDVRHFTPMTRRRYEDLARSAGLVVALGSGMPAMPAAGVRGGVLDADDPMRDEWDIAVVGPHFAAALVALDRGDDGPEAQRRFDYHLTYDRETVRRVAIELLDRVPASFEAGGRTLPGRVELVADRDGSGPHVMVEGSVEAALRTLAGTGLQARALAASTQGISIADVREAHQPLIYVNPAFTRITGFTAEEVLGVNCRVLQGEGTDPVAARALGDLVRVGAAGSVRVRNYRKDGSPFWNEVHLSPVRDDRGEVTHYIGIQHDVTDAVETQQQLEWLARHDELTGLLNRSALESAVSASGGACTLLFIDLDDFKDVNDEHGHSAGDEMLRQVAQRLRSVVRSEDALVRFGGDEFVIVLTGPGASAGRRVADAVLDALREPVHVAGTTLQVGASVGVSTAPDRTDLEDLLRRADIAMYRAKAAGRGAVVLLGDDEVPSLVSTPAG